MLYSISSAEYPLIYASSGMLISPDQFLHPNRLLDTYVLILVREGELYITTGDISCTVRPNQFIVLFPGLRHYGTKPSKGRLSYYWMHFSIRDPGARIQEGDLPDINTAPTQTGSPFPSDSEQYRIPVFGDLGNDRKPSLIFQGLLDMTKREHYQVSWQCHYLASYLLLEVLHGMDMQKNSRQVSDAIVMILEYIQAHYAEPISTSDIAARFDYHPVYLERLFKKEMGVSLTHYINQTRIEASKNLLLYSMLPLDSIATSCGFNDVKYYMRVFRQYVGMTPSQYKTNLFQKKVNMK